MHLVNLRTIRTERRLSQTALAKLAKTPQTVISQLERGMPAANQSLIAKLAKALNVDSSKLVAPRLVALDDSPADGVS